MTPVTYLDITTRANPPGFVAFHAGQHAGTVAARGPYGRLGGAGHPEPVSHRAHQLLWQLRNQSPVCVALVAASKRILIAGRRVIHNPMNYYRRPDSLFILTPT